MLVGTGGGKSGEKKESRVNNGTINKEIVGLSEYLK